MEYKRFASHGSDNPLSDISMKREMRHFPLKRSTWGTRKSIMEKKEAMVKRMAKFKK